MSLLPPDAPDADLVGEQLEQALRAAGYERVARNIAYRSNIELFQILRVAGLVVMELGLEDSITSQLNAVAHALCIPAIRTMRPGHDLPWLFQGHPGGYSRDIVTWDDPTELASLVEPLALQRLAQAGHQSPVRFPGLGAALQNDAVPGAQRQRSDLDHRVSGGTSIQNQPRKSPLWKPVARSSGYSEASASRTSGGMESSGP